jgi:hypothetical protein
MGDKFQFIDVKMINGGLLQVDFMNMTKQEGGRMFISPERFFEKLGRSMQHNHHNNLQRKKMKREKEKLDGK